MAKLTKDVAAFNKHPNFLGLRGFNQKRRRESEMEDIARKIMGVGAHEQVSGSGKSTARQFLCKHPSLRECFIDNIDADDGCPTTVILDGSFLLGSMRPHSKAELRRTSLITCRDYVERMRSRVEREFRTHPDVHTVILAFDVPEFVPPAKACEHVTRHNSNEAQRRAVQEWIDAEHAQTSEEYFGRAFYDPKHTCVDAADRDARLARLEEEAERAAPARLGELQSEKRRLLRHRTLCDMLDDASGPLPAPLTDVLSDKRRARYVFIRWLVHALTMAPGTTVKLRPGHRLIISGHCFRPCDFDDDDSGGDDDGASFEDQASVYTTPIVLMRPNERVAPSICFVAELQNFVGEADQSMYFFVSHLWNSDPVRYNTFVIVTTDTDAISSGLAFLDLNARRHPHAAIKIYNMYAQPGKVAYCALHRLYNNLETHFARLAAAADASPPCAPPVHKRRPMLHTLMGNEPRTRYETDAAEELCDRVDALANRYPYDDISRAPPEHTHPVGPVSQFVALLALFSSDYGRSWPKLGFVKWWLAVTHFPAKCLPLVERDILRGDVVYNPPAVWELVTCAYSIANEAAFPGRRAAGTLSDERRVAIDAMTPAERCRVIWKHRSQLAQFARCDIERGDADTYAKLCSTLPPDGDAVFMRLCNAQYFLYILQQTGLSVINMPPLEPAGYVRPDRQLVYAYTADT